MRTTKSASWHSSLIYLRTKSNILNPTLTVFAFWSRACKFLTDYIILLKKYHPKWYTAKNLILWTSTWKSGKHRLMFQSYSICKCFCFCFLQGSDLEGRHFQRQRVISTIVWEKRKYRKWNQRNLWSFDQTRWNEKKPSHSWITTKGNSKTRNFV